MIKKLRIELALHRVEKVFKRTPRDPLFTEPLYKILQAESEIEKGLDKEYVYNRNSFISKLESVSDERKNLLSIVESKIDKLLDKNPDLFKKYNAVWSYLYFTFTDELESNVFSSPHITSPVLFDPNEDISTYTLFSPNQGRLNHSEYTNTYKRVVLDVAAYNSYPIPANVPHSASKKVYPDKQKFINSLFDYYEKNSSGNVLSCYKDTPNVISGIKTISDYEMKRFIYLAEEDTIEY